MPACFDIGEQFFVFSGAKWQFEKEKLKRSLHVLALERRDSIFKSENRHVYQTKLKTCRHVRARGGGGARWGRGVVGGSEPW